MLAFVGISNRGETDRTFKRGDAILLTLVGEPRPKLQGSQRWTDFDSSHNDEIPAAFFFVSPFENIDTKFFTETNLFHDFSFTSNSVLYDSVCFGT